MSDTKILLKSETKVYVIRLKDREMLLKSSSGRALTVMSDYFLDKSNIVVFAVYNYQIHTEEFIFLHNHNVEYSERRLA